MKVLVYDNVENHIRLLKQFLNQVDYDLVIEKDEQNILTHFEGELPALIISNFDLPEGGIKLVNNMLATLKPPFPYVLFLTDPHSEQFAVDCLGPIPGDFVAKPVRMEELRARITVAERVIALQNHLRAQHEIPPDLALYDNLTNLLNRQAIYERVLAEVNRAGREKTPTCLSIFEITNIEDLKEEYGSKITDQAIRFVARAIRANIRIYDIVGRWMDAQFMLMLPGLRPEYSQNVIERIYTALHSVRIRMENDHLLPLVLAAGYTSNEVKDAVPLYMMIEQTNKALSYASELEKEIKISSFESVKEKV